MIIVIDTLVSYIPPTLIDASLGCLLFASCRSSNATLVASNCNTMTCTVILEPSTCHYISSIYCDTVI